MLNLLTMPNILSIMLTRGDIMCRRRPSQYEVVQYIKEANDWQISEIIHAAIHRFNQVFPEWEVSFLSVPRNNPEEREKMLRSILEFHQNH